MLQMPSSALLLFSALASAAPQTVRLNDDLPVGLTAGDVQSFQVTADGTHVVYLADVHDHELWELVSVRRSAAGNPTVLSAASLDRVTEFAVSPVDLQVVYAGWGRDSGQLYATRADGSVGSTLLARGRASRLAISPEGSRVVFVTDIPGGKRLRTVPVDGSAPARTIADLDSDDGDFSFAAGGSRVVFSAFGSLYTAPSDDSAAPVAVDAHPDPVQRFTVTPDGARVVFLRGSLATAQLYSAPVDASSSSVLLHTSLTAGLRVAVYSITPDSTRVLFRTDIQPAGRSDLFSVPVGGGTEVRLNIPLEPSDTVVSWRLAPAGDAVIFRTEPAPFRKSVFHSSPIDGSAPAVVVAHIDGFVKQHELAPDGSRIVFSMSTTLTGSTYTLFSMPVDGSAPPTSLNSGSTTFTFQVDPAGGRVLFLASPDLFSVPFDGSEPPLRLSSVPPGPYQEVAWDYRIVAGGHALYRADQETPDVMELFEVPLDASTPRKLSGALAPSVLGRVNAFQTSAEAAFYLADQESAGVQELYRVALDDPRRRKKLSAPLVAGGGVADFQLARDCNWIIYRADQEQDERYELYAVRADGRSAPVQICGPLPSFSSVSNFRVAPDCSRVVFRADLVTDDVRELFSVAAGGVPILLNDPVGEGAQLTQFEVSADSRRVVYRADYLTDGVFEVFSAPIDHGGGQVRLHGSPVADGDTYRFELGPDGRYVAFSGDLLVDRRIQLFAAPTDGSAPARLLEHAWDTRELQPDFRFTADGTRVVFAVGDEDATLYSSPADGSSLPVFLGSGEYIEFAVAPTGPWLAFRSESGLFSVRADGSQGPLLLHPGPFGFAITPDGTRVVLAHTGITVVPIDASSEPVVLGVHQHVQELGFAWGGQDLLYSTTYYSGHLFAVPLDGSRVPEHLASAVLYGNVSEFQAPSEGRVVFRGGVRLRSISELWLTHHGKPARLAAR